jgi:putative ABC transport system ATP-binding protein
MLEIRGASKIFSKGTMNERIALDAINLVMKDGEFATIIGGNGAGKSTLLNCISGLYHLDSGSISLNGQNMTNVPEYIRSNSIGRVFQDPLKGTAFDMTIEENLAIAWYKGKRRDLRPGITKKDTNYYREKLSHLELGLEDRMKSKVGLLSGGQRQALTLLMATIVKPEILLLDEHTAALDPGTARKVLELTKSIVEEDKITTFMVTHNMKAALELGSRILMMHGGRIVFDASSDEKKNLTVDQLVERFEEKSGEGLDNDRMLLG